MNRLLVDAGNSRIKWAVHDGRGWSAEGAVATAQAKDLGRQWQGLPAIERAIYCCVADESVAADTAAGVQAAFGIVPQRFTARARIGAFSNGYDDPGQLGADRLAAALGAWHACHEDLLVVMAGTAVTVDLVAAEGRFVGGMILPGMRLMRAALHQGTAALPEAGGQVRAAPGNTADAIATGIQEAIVGAIDRAHARFGRPQLIVSGGDAALLHPLLPAAREIPNLVLEGLLAAAPHLD